MELFGLINIGVLPLLLEGMSPAAVRPQPHEQEARYLKQERNRMNEKLSPQAKLTRDLQQQQAMDEQNSERNVLRHQQVKVQLEQRGYQAEHHAIWDKYRAIDWQSEHRNWQERGGYDGYRIPADRSLGFFGPGHAFRVFNNPLVVLGGHPMFQYSNIWFSVLDLLPEYWSGNWYKIDDVYIDYSGGGYYLCNRKHPLDRIALTAYAN